MASLSGKNDFHPFAVRARRYGRNIAKNSKILVRNVGNRVIQTLATRTPADVGTAISNWQVAIDHVPQGTIPAHSPGKNASTRDQNARITVARAKEIIAQYKTESTIHITNNLVYISMLNNGSSTQAPAGFVQAAIQAAKIPISRVKLLKD